MVKRYEVDSDPQDGPCSIWATECDNGEYVMYEDYAALDTKLLALLEHPAVKAHAEALAQAQITGLAFIRVNANGHVQVLPSDRVRISVIQAVEERTAAAAHQECDHPKRVIWVNDTQICEPCGICDVTRIRRKTGVVQQECDHLWQQHLGEPEFRECIRCGRVEDVYE